MKKRCCTNCVFGERPAGVWWRQVLAKWPGALVCVQGEKAKGSLSLVAGEWKCAKFRLSRASGVRGEVPETTSEGVRYIKLTLGKYAIVDAEDYERLARYKWHARESLTGRTFYACRCEHGRTISMHREIMQPPPGMVIDHADGNGLYNRRRNIRVCTRAQNMQNTRRRPQEGKKSMFRGVSGHGDRWIARFNYDGKEYYIGLFDTEVEAAMARDRKAVELAGQYAQLNFPREVLEARWPELRACRSSPPLGSTSA